MKPKSSVSLKKKYKCTQCQAETNDEGDIHCRKIFKEKLDWLLKKKDLTKAEDLIKTAKFNDFYTNNWINEHKKIIENLKKTEAKKEITKEEINKIFVKIKNNELLSEHEILKLKKSKKNESLAYYHYNRFQVTGDPWELSKSCSSYRNADMPTAGIKVTNKLGINKSDKKAVAAVLTSKGGAYKDLRNLEKAQECANEAIKLNPTSYFPYTLLGAVLILEEKFESASQCFEKASSLGAVRKNIEKEIQIAAADLSQEAREKMEKIFYGK